MPEPRLPSGLLVGLCAWALLLPTPARPADQADPLEAGLQCFAELDYACAVELLGAACTAPYLPAERLRLGLTRLAESHLALGQREAAVAALQRLLEREPSLALPAEAPPKLQAALEEARRLRTPGPGPGDARADAQAEARADTWLRLGLGGGGEFLLGRDAELLQHGPLLELEASLELNALVRVGLGLRWSQHGLRTEGRDAALQALGAWLEVGVAGDVGPVGLQAMLGFGLHHFGVLGEEAKSGVWVPLRLGVDFRLLSWLRLGVCVVPALTALPDEGRTSLTIGLAAGLQFEL
ncbi:MAG TPA: tetratricopeptide repeat protein [Myxococcota bacterium]|nr:tetratricopeptide repeat protein [Myxococcota bacterium]HRY92062.1 tetratricopeptide repeat protein [Myxococcota bacterium]HSA21442.1 tetratricopeptide repeat protein [Myxococcota bacterium]